ncbi:OmpA family protein [Nonomuraea sp. NPDC048826]|uniref:OmpA family protein n=1 Tax=Nonomuraea sp. NPDC048826 TaxID=3364347 RepID=UPI003718B104
MRGAGLAAVLLIVVLAGCGASGPPEGGGSPSASPPAASPPASPSASVSGVGYVREGLVGYHASDAFRVEVKSVERHPDLTVLRMEIATTQDTKASGDFGYDGLPGQSVSFGRFRLLDPVGRKVYFTLRDKSGEMAFGTRHNTARSTNFPEEFLPGVSYPVEVYFPPLPAGVRAVSLVPDLAMAPTTGVPVTDGAPPPVAKERGEGGEHQWQVVLPTEDPWSGVSGLNELVETPEKTTFQEGGKETVALRTDVLFAFDKATLSKRAAAILDEAVAETRERADPDKPPVIIEGHTDSKGGDSYNQELSVRRAEAVRDYLADKLGDGYVYKAEGKGESEPIAKNEKRDGSDNPQGRARNRRVEISYTIKKERPDVTVTTRPATDVRGSTRQPAPYRADAGPVVGSLRWTGGQDRLRVDFHPFHRDGAYLVAAFDVVLESGRLYIPVPGPFNGFDHEFSAASDFGSFILVHPETEARYHPLKMHTEFVENSVFNLEKGEVSRAYVYYPAPADDVTSITLEADGLGEVKDIPVQ